jgi:hypothetical protein
LSDLAQDLPPPPPELLTTNQFCAKSLSIDNLHLVKTQAGKNSNKGCCVTMPRSTAKTGQTTGQVVMRRSSSVPCKIPENRGSTSSSDSGFSTAGSPTAIAAAQAAGLNHNMSTAV